MVAAVVATLLAGFLVVPSGQSTHATVDAHAIVAIIDTGIHPAAGAFQLPELTAHPSTYVSGYPASAEALSQDLAGAQPGRLYYVPGTRVIGAISLGEFENPLQCPASPQKRPIHDDCGHGNSVAMRAAAQSPHVLIVAVEVPQPDVGLAWAIDQPWIDVISLSWGTPANAPVPGIEALTKKATDLGKIVTVAAGNGLTGTGLVPDRSLTYTSPMSGPAWVVSVGAVSDYSKRDYSWHAIPVDVAAGSPLGGGTSFATPVVAGQIGRVLAEVRGAVGDTGEGPRDGALVVAPPAGDADLPHPCATHGGGGADRFKRSCHNPRSPFFHTGSSLPSTGPLADGRLDRLELEEAVMKTAAFTPRDSPTCRTDGLLVEDPSCRWGDVYDLLRECLRDGHASRGPGECSGFPATGIDVLPAWHDIVQGRLEGTQPPTPADLLFEGYGIVNAESGLRAVEVILGASPTPDRSVEDAFMEASDTVRSSLWPMKGAGNRVLCATDAENPLYSCCRTPDGDEVVCPPK